MARLRKSYACLIVAVALLVILPVLAQPISNLATENRAQPATKEIILEANRPDIFKWYNTNGTPPNMNGYSALFFGSNRTNMYSDVVSLSTVTAQKSLVLEAQIAVNMSSFSSTGEDQFAVFATDDTTNYKSDEFGFVLPEIGSTWYAYVQSPQIGGFFTWKPILTGELNRMEQHNFKAVYSNSGLLRLVDFYVDGKLVWSTAYPNVSGKDLHMVLTSHKVSADSIDLSRNQMEVENAVLSDMIENHS